MKICPGCKLQKEFTEFSEDSRYKSGYTSYCRECTRDKNRNIYKRNNSAAKKRDATKIKRRKELKQKLVALLGGKCSRCGYDRCIDALDFHHTSGKEHGMAKLITNSLAKNGEYTTLLMAEIKKCIILCANCHREIHYEEYQNRL